MRSHRQDILKTISLDLQYDIRLKQLLQPEPSMFVTDINHDLSTEH